MRVNWFVFLLPFRAVKRPNEDGCRSSANRSRFTVTPCLPRISVRRVFPWNPSPLDRRRSSSTNQHASIFLFFCTAKVPSLGKPLLIPIQLNRTALSHVRSRRNGRAFTVPCATVARDTFATEYANRGGEESRLDVRARTLSLAGTGRREKNPSPVSRNREPRGRAEPDTRLRSIPVSQRRNGHGGGESRYFPSARGREKERYDGVQTRDTMSAA